ncbi:hypothetical protein TNCV_4577161 [Trichonephila clavipes]|nr:hypothetical protein TNCV_4577161 [Trichonephila clavipes]
MDFTPFPCPALMRDFFGRGGPMRKKKIAESPEMDFTPFPCPALIRDFFGGIPREKSRRSHRKWTSRRFPHHSSAKVKLKTIFLSLTLFPILNSQAEKKNVQTIDNSPPVKHIEHTKQISQAKRPTTDNSPPIKHIEHTKQISQAKRPTTDNSPPIKHIEHTRQLPSLVAQVHQRQIENATQG